MALTPSAVIDEPLIQNGRCAQGTGPDATPAIPELRGDVLARGFWERNTSAVFDVRVTDTNAQSHRDTPADRILASQEKDKKRKYLTACLDKRMTFTPLVFSVDGQRGMEANAAINRLASLLATKWKQPFSHTCGFVRSRLSVALARSITMCLRGSRTGPARGSRPMWDSGAGLGLYR